ncbi:unnamed protein product [Prorocentrum cordatum]|uniref:dolichyl-diphosphooligosaccharide--protein glycotransferase n=1 Tax=Prorocentrum cordatum TaxID=2364126 RepID=A0ABN9T7G4_9DINO|nr:unnamed protein product [Polarella glacialis]
MGDAGRAAKHHLRLESKLAEQKVEPPLQQRVGEAATEMRILEGRLSKAASYYERLQCDLEAQRQLVKELHLQVGGVAAAEVIPAAQATVAIPIEDILQGKGPPINADSLPAPEAESGLSPEDKAEAEARPRSLQQAIRHKAQQLFGAAAEQAAKFREEQRKQRARLASKRRRMAEAPQTGGGANGADRGAGAEADGSAGPKAPGAVVRNPLVTMALTRACRVAGAMVDHAKTDENDGANEAQERPFNVSEALALMGTVGRGFTMSDAVSDVQADPREGEFMQAVDGWKASAEGRELWEELSNGGASEQVAKASSARMAWGVGCGTLVDCLETFGRVQTLSKLHHGELGCTSSALGERMRAHSVAMGQAGGEGIEENSGLENSATTHMVKNLLRAIAYVSDDALAPWDGQSFAGKPATGDFAYANDPMLGAATEDNDPFDLMVHLDGENTRPESILAFSASVPQIISSSLLPFTVGSIADLQERVSGKGKGKGVDPSFRAHVRSVEDLAINQDSMTTDMAFGMMSFFMKMMLKAKGSEDATLSITRKDAAARAEEFERLVSDESTWFKKGKARKAAFYKAISEGRLPDGFLSFSYLSPATGRNITRYFDTMLSAENFGSPIAFGNMLDTEVGEFFHHVPSGLERFGKHLVNVGDQILNASRIGVDWLTQVAGPKGQIADEQTRCCCKGPSPDMCELLAGDELKKSWNPAKWGERLAVLAWQEADFGTSRLLREREGGDVCLPAGPQLGGAPRGGKAKAVGLPGRARRGIGPAKFLLHPEGLSGSDFCGQLLARAQTAAPMAPRANSVKKPPAAPGKASKSGEKAKTANDEVPRPPDTLPCMILRFFLDLTVGSIKLILVGGSCLWAYRVRKTGIPLYGYMIHGFDPTFNFTAARYLARKGWYEFFRWYDHMSWYPLGRPVGTTIYPGMQVFSVWLHQAVQAMQPGEFRIPGLAWLPTDMNKCVREKGGGKVCVMTGPWLSAVATFFLAMTAAECSESTGARATPPASEPLETSTTGPLSWAAGTSGSLEAVAPGALFYYFSVATWGGYIFVNNLIALHAAVIVAMGRYDSGVHRAYTIWYVFGTFGATFVPPVGYAPVKSLEQAPAALVFLVYQFLESCDIYRRRQKKEMKDWEFFFFRVRVFGSMFAAFLAVCFVLGQMNYFSPMSSRIRGLFLKHQRTGNPLVDSVAEHQPASKQAYEVYLGVARQIAVFGLPLCWHQRTPAKVFPFIFAAVAYNFSMKMSRLMIICGPACGMLAGYPIPVSMDFGRILFGKLFCLLQTAYGRLIPVLAPPGSVFSAPLGYFEAAGVQQLAEPVSFVSAAASLVASAVAWGVDCAFELRRLEEQVRAGLAAAPRRVRTVLVRTRLGVTALPQLRVLLVALLAQRAMVVAVSLGLLVFLVATIVQLAVAPCLLKCIQQVAPQCFLLVILKVAPLPLLVASQCKLIVMNTIPKTCLVNFTFVLMLLVSLMMAEVLLLLRGTPLVALRVLWTLVLGMWLGTFMYADAIFNYTTRQHVKADMKVGFHKRVMASPIPSHGWQRMLQALVYSQSRFRPDAAAILKERLVSEGLWHRACPWLAPTSPSYLQRAVGIEWDLRLTAERCDVILPSSMAGEITQQMVADAVRSNGSNLDNFNTELSGSARGDSGQARGLWSGSGSVMRAGRDSPYETSAGHMSIRHAACYERGGRCAPSEQCCPRSEWVQYCERSSHSFAGPGLVTVGRDRTLIDDKYVGYEWLMHNTPEHSRVLSWWDYGYQITGIGNRTSLADGNTWNHEHIATIGRILSGQEKKSYNTMRHLADYVLVHAGTGQTKTDLQISTHFARIGNSVFPDHCGDQDPTCTKYSFLAGGQPSKMMAQSFVYKAVKHGQDGVQLNPKFFKEVHSTKRGMIRIFQVLNVSQESKDWVANPANRKCDAPGSWYCVGQYPPALAPLIALRKDFAQSSRTSTRRGRKARTRR